MNRMTAAILLAVAVAIGGLSVAIHRTAARRHRLTAGSPVPVAASPARSQPSAPEIAAALARDAGVATQLAAATPGKLPPGCNAPPPPEPPPAARGIEIFAMEAYAKAFTGDKTPANYSGAEFDAKARAMTEEIARGNPTEFWSACMERFTAVAGANRQRPMVECIDAIDICRSDRGGYGCCPRACIEEHKRLMRLRCKGGCGRDDEMRVLEEGIFSGRCVPGRGELVAEGRRADEDAVHGNNRQQRLQSPLVAAAGDVLFASSPDGLRYSRDEGAHWRSADDGLDDTPLAQLVSDPAGRAVFALGRGNLFAWTGSRWMRLWDGEFGHNGVMISGYNLQQIFVDRRGGLWLRHYQGAERTTDRGRSWSHIALPEQQNLPELTLMSDGSIVCARFKAFRSTDEGASWTAIPEHMPDGRLVSGGDGWLYWPRGFQRSRDGHHWESAGPSPIRGGDMRLAVDRAGTMLAASRNRQLFRRVAGGEWQLVDINR